MMDAIDRESYPYRLGAAEAQRDDAIAALQRFKDVLVASAERQKAYWMERQRSEKALEDGISDDGEHTPLGDHECWQSGYCNGRYSEADWWVSTLRSLAQFPTDPAQGEA